MNKATYTKIRNLLEELQIQDTEDISEGIQAILNNETCEEYFSFIDIGCFKEVYALNEDWVIKLCSSDNDTEKESQILAWARSYNLSQIFIPTFFIQLEDKVESAYLECEEYLEDDKGNWSVVPRMINYIEIQAVIDRTVADKSFIVFGEKENYDAHPLYCRDEPVSYEYLAEFGIESLSWLEDVIIHYGADVFERLHDFIVENFIHDLHNSNIGYRREGNKLLPCIMDWLS